MSTEQLSTDQIVARALGKMEDAIGGLTADEKSAVAAIGEPSPVQPTHWFPGTAAPAHDGEFEVLHPVTGMPERAVYDTLFEAWSCEWQYPTWRGLRGVGS